MPDPVSLLSLTLAYELGDKTFLIAAILAIQCLHISILLDCTSALVIMTIFPRVGLGFAANAIPTVYTSYVYIGKLTINDKLYEESCSRQAAKFAENLPKYHWTI